MSKEYFASYMNLYLTKRKTVVFRFSIFDINMVNIDLLEINLQDMEINSDVSSIQFRLF